MKQVYLTRDGQSQIAWIDAEAAFLGYEVELKETSTFWKVADVYHVVIDSNEIKEHERNYLSHRKATDI